MKKFPHSPNCKQRILRLNSGAIEKHPAGVMRLYLFAWTLIWLRKFHLIGRFNSGGSFNAIWISPSKPLSFSLPNVPAYKIKTRKLPVSDTSAVLECLKKAANPGVKWGGKTPALSVFY